jgi:type II secretory pathway predicted ATPase ExeA
MAAIVPPAIVSGFKPKILEHYKMKKTLLTLIALAFVSGPAFAMKHEAPKADDKLAAACKDKKAGDTVKVDGKDAKCPDKKAKK